MFKKTCGKDIIDMHDVAIFIMLTMGKMLKGGVLNSCDVYFVTIVL
jgi:hypothetical protein